MASTGAYGSSPTPTASYIPNNIVVSSQPSSDMDDFQANNNTNNSQNVHLLLPERMGHESDQPAMILKPESCFGLACFACCCCFCPIGLIALVRSVQCRSAWCRGNFAQAEALSKQTFHLIVASLVLAVFYYPMLIAFGLTRYH